MGNNWAGWRELEPDSWLNRVRSAALSLQPNQKPSVSKYRSRRTQVLCTFRGELWFHSAKEAARYQELRLLEIAGAIAELELQPPFDLLVPSGEVVTTFHADFRYLEVVTGKVITEDVKSEATTQDRAWSVRKRWAEACHGIKIVNPYE